MTFRIAHVSDIHLQNTEDEHEYLDQLFNTLNRYDVDHLVVTGDISEWGDARAFQLFDAKRHEYGFGPKRSTVLPGNHDVRGFSHYEKRFGEWLWKIRRLDKGRINLISCDSTKEMECPYGAGSFLEKILGRNVDNVYGYFDDEERKKLIRLLDRSQSGRAVSTIVALHHHVFPGYCEEVPGRLPEISGLPQYVGPLGNADDFRALMRDFGVSVCLTGHMHGCDERNQRGIKYLDGDDHEGFWIVDFEEGKLSRVVHVALCDTCDGTGTVECEECDENGDVDCEDCEGSGWVICPVCEGEDEDCPHCYENYEVVCDECGGDGYVPCDECDNEGLVPCDECGE